MESAISCRNLIALDNNASLPLTSSWALRYVDVSVDLTAAKEPICGLIACFAGNCAARALAGRCAHADGQFPAG